MFGETDTCDTDPPSHFRPIFIKTRGLRSLKRELESNCTISDTAQAQPVSYTKPPTNTHTHTLTRNTQTHTNRHTITQKLTLAICYLCTLYNINMGWLMVNRVPEDIKNLRLYNDDLYP